MIRTSDAMGADGVIFAGETVEPLGCKVSRSSAGSLFHVPVARDPLNWAVAEITCAMMLLLRWH